MVIRHFISYNYVKYRGRAYAAPLPKITHPRQPHFGEVARVSPPQCNGRPLLGRSSFLIKDSSSAKSVSENSEEKRSVTSLCKTGIEHGPRARSPATKNCAPQPTTICGSGEHQPTQVQWRAFAREILLRDQG
ncbi:hypothetical protein TNCT_653051 [Trichonephila clavata]|uniref:Uncharacterized protein n=1 Tax=Trichonephila clavata TaxID=2740835 RepID=A0A8X6L3E6_TRICU|nr:hypothetical protein TNCT_653051 [Trichonephila clavata]